MFTALGCLALLLAMGCAIGWSRTRTAELANLKSSFDSSAYPRVGYLYLIGMLVGVMGVVSALWLVQ